MYEFKYHRPTTLAEAAEIHSVAADAQYMAGGQTLLPSLKFRLSKPSDVIDLASIMDLSFIRVEGDALLIGAATLHADVAASETVRTAIPALATLAELIGDPQVRNSGTLGGAIANNDPAADYPAAVLGLGATVITTGREIAGDDFFTDMFETALEEGEIITAVRFPTATKAGYAKFPNPASRYAIVGVFAAETASGVRVAVTGAGPCVFRATAMEAALGQALSSKVELPAPAADDLNSDMHASAEYRAHLVTVMAKRAIADALA
ncbi:MAG: xanthine dehydrogenase family protein subunit M [Proteobacteria bacterium]|nr:xanthine dehydrogenase family protein subunit M [Pseudomonadota bacterium]MDA1355981.1 xanthine dehydrogenase family protein subunit M [Pseudomonadota bacterium]